MKEYCVDLELAKELKENGFFQNTKFCWEEDYLDGTGQPDIILLKNRNRFPEANYYSAPTSDEILKELPSEIYKNYGQSYGLLIAKNYGEDNRDGYSVDYDNDGNSEVEIFADLKLSNALAKMWLYLKKEGYIK